MKIDIRKPSNIRLAVAGLLLAAIAVFPELSIELRIAGVIATVPILFVGITNTSQMYTQISTRKHMKRALQRVASRNEVWSCNWRVIFYRLGHPGADRLYGAAIFHRKEVLPHVEGWRRTQWSTTQWMNLYIRRHIEHHMKTHNWLFSEHPYHLYRHWGNTVPLDLIVDEIIEIASMVGISVEDMVIELIGESTSKQS